MKRILLFLLTVQSAPLAFGQVFALPADSVVDLRQDLGHHLEVRGVLDYNANSVYNELPLAILRGGYLSPERRQRSLDALRSVGNTAGYLLEGRLKWSWRNGDKRWRPLISLAHKEMGGLAFTRDQFAIAFFGNAAYENRTASLSPSGYEQWRYQTLGFGYRDPVSHSFFRLDLVRGQSFAQVDVREADLFTGTNGRVLRSRMVGDYHASDTAGQGFDRTNGLGLALSGRWNTLMNMGAKVIELAAGVEDLGMVQWNDRSVQVRKDTLITFSGFEVENIFALDDVIIGEETLLDTFGLRYRTGSFTRVMPFRAHLSGSTELGGTWRVGMEVDYRYLPGYIPQVALQGSRRLGDRTLMASTISYGGFGGLRWGLSGKRRFGEHLLISIATSQIPALATDQARGLGVFFGVEGAF